MIPSTISLPDPGTHFGTDGSFEMIWDKAACVVISRFQKYLGASASSSTTLNEKNMSTPVPLSPFKITHDGMIINPINQILNHINKSLALYMIIVFFCVFCVH